MISDKEVNMKEDKFKQELIKENKLKVIEKEKNDKTEKYFRCPYCSMNTDSGHEVRVPKTVGKFRVRQIFNNFLVLKCAKCSRITKVEIVPQLYMWDRMSVKETKDFKTIQYKKYKGGDK